MTATLAIANPADGSTVATVPADTPASVAEKSLRARAAQVLWAATPLAERKAAIGRFRQSLVDDRESLARTLTSEVGKPIAQSRNELAGVLARIDFFLANVDGTTGPTVVHDEGGMVEGISHEPLGVVGNVSAWNYPYFVGANVFVPALLTGNAVLYKPSEFATLTGLAIGERLHAAGVPADVFAVCVGAGAIGRAVVESTVDGLFFTGSVATGQAIAAQAGGRMLRLQLELGGKDPTYVCDDVDAEFLSMAAASLADGAMYNTGQSCCSVERLYVHERVHDDFVARFLETAAGFRVGDPMDDATHIGPLTRGPQIAVLQAQVDDAVARGATVRLGGKRIARKGHWFEPTVLTGVDHTMALMRDESFGPIIGIQKVQGDEEAIGLMNDTRYGLTAGVYAQDEARAATLLGRLRAGSVYWNCCDRVSPRLPWSGVGDSGVGVTLSTLGIGAFTRPRAWHLKRAA